jgi:hypothetical protein
LNPEQATTPAHYLNDPSRIAAMFSRDDGSYHFARWGRPITPVIFGLAEDSLPAMKGAIEATVALAGHKMAETDPEMGANLMMFFLRDWDELMGLPDLDQLVPDLVGLISRLKSANAGQYRVFRYEDTGAMRAAVVLICVAKGMNDGAAQDIGLEQAVKSLLNWSPAAFADMSPLVIGPDGIARLRADVAAVLTAAYDPLMPPADQDPSHALRLYGRVSVALAGA